jgi:hypothetical protein
LEKVRAWDEEAVVVKGERRRRTWLWKERSARWARKEASLGLVK